MHASTYTPSTYKYEMTEAPSLLETDNLMEPWRRLVHNHYGVAIYGT